MSNFFDSLFSKKIIFVVLIIFLVAVALVFWDFKFLEYLTGSADLSSGLDISSTTEATAVFAMVGVGALVTGIFSVLVICNVLFWMVPCLFKALFCLLGAIPIVNIFFSAELRESWSEAIDEWLTPNTYLTFDPFSLFLVDVVEEESDGLIFHFIFSSIAAFIKGVLGCIGYIIAAVGIPLSCPLVTILAMGGIVAVTENPVWLVVIGMVCFLIVGFALIGIPVIALTRKIY